jgi:aldose 1-epimerase
MAAEIVTLRDTPAGTSAHIAVNLGFNCFRFTAMLAERHGGRSLQRKHSPERQPVEVLYSHPEFAAGAQRPSGSGIPILFPFPGRIPGTTFTWEGKHYPLEAGDALGNAIHGFVLRRPWRVLEQSESRVAGQFHAWRDDPSLEDRWPADFRITATYAISGNSLDSEFVIENPGQTPLPFGLGTHPYFRVPLGGLAADDCIVRLPVSARWELAEMLPTGRRLALAFHERYDAGRRLGELKLDDVFTGLTSEQGSCVASIENPDGASVRIRWSPQEFRECVVYTPPHREAICIEPLTCAPGAMVLSERGIDAGWRVLPPGGRFTAKIAIVVD